MPRLARLQMLDNSAQVAPCRDIPEPVLVLEMVRWVLVFPRPGDEAALHATPEWAQPIVQGRVEGNEISMA